MAVSEKIGAQHRGLLAHPQDVRGGQCAAGEAMATTPSRISASATPTWIPPGRPARPSPQIIASPIPRKHGYMPNAGYPEVRERVAEYVSAEQGVRLGRDKSSCPAAPGAL